MQPKRAKISVTRLSDFLLGAVYACHCRVHFSTQRALITFVRWWRRGLKATESQDQPQPHAVVDGRTSSLGYRQSVMEMR